VTAAPLPPTTGPATTTPPAATAATRSSTTSTASPLPTVRYVAGSTRKICQLTGDTDRQAGIPTTNLTETRSGIWGTDLGSSFEHEDRVVFLFGDTIGARGGDLDVLAWTDDPDPEDCIDLEFPEADGAYAPLRVPGISQGAYEVPVGGFSVGGEMFVYLVTGGVEMPRSVLAHSTDGGRSFEMLHEVSTDRFRNISPVPASGIGGLPGDGTGFLLFGSGDYRSSNPYLAYLPPEAVGRPDGLRYFAGTDASGEPVWSGIEAAAEPLFEQPCIGELSAMWNEYLGRWLLLYNCDDPRGINLRSAPTPWGPWSAPEVIFEPWEDGGYCEFIHVSWDLRRCDSVHDPGREREWGGEYGPYVIARYTRGRAGASTIYYTRSTWNPYNVVLMRTDLALGG
jgi:hypothetical protein